MIRNEWTVCALSLLLLATACGEDRTYEYEEKTARDHWMVAAMQDEYLWGDSIKESRLGWKDFFAKPSDFFAKLTAMAPVKDVWSWCEVDTVQADNHTRGLFNHLNSYGLDIVVMTDPTGETSRQWARVVTVLEGSPAARCGLERGDFIGAVDGTRLTSSNASTLLGSGRARALVRQKLGAGEDGVSLLWASTDTLSMEKSEWVEDVPFPLVKQMAVGSRMVAYVMCNRLTHGAVERAPSSTAYEADLQTAMARVGAMGADAMVLDLRLCNDGTLPMARRLASWLVDASRGGGIFAQTLYRESRKMEDATYFFDADVAGALGIEHLYVLVGSHTSGAAEWVIRGIRAAMGPDFVTTIGATTAGQTVMTGEVRGAEYLVTLHPAVAYVADASGDYAYAGGLVPDAEVNEFAYVALYPYGDAREILLETALSLEAER